MVELHILGDALIKVGGKEIRPTSPMLFASLLYLGMERGRRISRAAMQALLFPHAEGSNGAHSLRQLLYKLKRLGVPVTTDAATVFVDSAFFTVDVTQVERELLDGERVARAAYAVLPGYDGGVSDGFTRWVEALRNDFTRRLSSILTALLARHRAASHLDGVERSASALLELDPLNESATLALAEARALRGQKQSAVQLLEAFAAEVSETSAKLRAPADHLRRRIEERLDAVERSHSPVFGREADVAWLLAQFNRANAGSPTISVVWGDAGVGKTRLVQEFAAHLLLKRARVETLLCQPTDVDRPLGALVDIVPRLLNARGALGAEPESLSILKHLVGHTDASHTTIPVDPDHATARLRLAITDLVVSVASESPLVAIVEDSQWLDAESIRLLVRGIPRQRASIHIVLTSRGRPSLCDERALADSVFVRQLVPLDDEASASLLQQAVGATTNVDAATIADSIALAGGNPLFLRTVAEHLRMRGGLLPARKQLTDLLKQRVRLLAPPPLLLIRALAILGNYGTPTRLFECTRLSDEVALLALQDIADRGLIGRREGVLKCAHDVLADVIVADTPEALRVVLHERVAAVLERDGAVDRNIGMIQAAAECWRSNGQQNRALDAFRLCAKMASEIGQSAFAARLLDDAQSLASDAALPSLIVDTIGAASHARQHMMLIRNVDRYSSRRDVPDPQRFTLARLHALQAIGQTVTPEIRSVLAKAESAEIPIEDRLVATRIALVDAMQRLDVAQGLRLAPLVQTLTSREPASWRSRELSLVFHTHFGSLDKAREEALALIESREPLMPILIASIAQALQYSGATDAARSLFEDQIAEATKRGIHNVAAKLCGQLAGLHASLGDFSAVARLVQDGEGHLEHCGKEYGAQLLYYKLHLAMQRRENVQAQDALALLKGHGEANAMHAIRTITGLEILVAHLDDSLDESTLDFDRLTQIDHCGRHLLEHALFALAHYVALTVAGKTANAAQSIRAYVRKHQRERYSMLPFFSAAALNSDVRDRLLADLSAAPRPASPLAQLGQRG